MKLKDDINWIIQERLEENESDITDINNLVNAAATIITRNMNKSSKAG
jgi:hypothetical protein